MKLLMLSIIALAFLSFTNPSSCDLRSIASQFIKNRVDNIDSISMFKIDTLTPKVRMQLHVSRIIDTIEILQPLMEAIAEQKERCDDAVKHYPKNDFFVKSSKAAKKTYDSTINIINPIIKRGKELEYKILTADSITFAGYVVHAVYFYNGIGDNAVVVITPDCAVIDKNDW